MSESEAIVYIDHSEILQGKIEELKAAMNVLASFVKSNEPRIIAYNAYFSQDGKHMTVIHVHPDPSSLELHMKVAGAKFSQFADFINMLGIDVYGNPGERLLEQLRGKARMLGSGTVSVHKRYTGFLRTGTT